MQTFTKRTKTTQQTTMSAKHTMPGRAHFGENRKASPLLQLHRSIDNHVNVRLAQTHTQELEDESHATALLPVAHDFSQIPVSPGAAKTLQRKLMVNIPGDAYEQEADHVAEQVIRMPEPQLQRTDPRGGGCPQCERNEGVQRQDRLRTDHMQTSNPEQVAAPPIVHEVLATPGHPLDSVTRAFMEPRFGRDFSNVRVHTDRRAAESAQAVNALAYTVGLKIVLNDCQYVPGTTDGARLLAHELAHVVQQERQPGVVPTGTIQRQKIPDSTPVAQVPRSMKDVEALVAELKARAAFLAAPFLKLEAGYRSEKLAQLQLVPDAGQHVHEALAFTFVLHNPDASIKSMNNDTVGIDTREIPEWKEKEPLEEVSRGTYLATKFPTYKKFFPTGPGTLWITRAGVKAYPSEYRDFLWRSGNVPESELAEILDSGYEQAADAAGEWIKSWDRETPREAPLLIQLIADLNPIMGIAKLVSLLKEKKPLYAMPGTKADNIDWVEGWVGLAAAGEAIFGDLLKVSVKGIQAAKVVNVGRVVANPTGKLSEVMVEKWTKECIKDETVKKIIADIITLGLDKGLWDGVIRNVDKVINKPEGNKGRAKPPKP
jgi:hypothetical protein